MPAKRVLKVFYDNLIASLTVVAVVFAMIIGVCIRNYWNEPKWTQRQLTYLEFPGELFLRSLMWLIIPLIVSSMISALGSLEGSFAGKIGARALVYYMSTTVIAIAIGVTLVITIHPGQRLTSNSTTSASTTTTTQPKNAITTIDTVLDLVRNLIPTNLVEACTSSYTTVLTPSVNGSNEDINTWSIGHVMSQSPNILGLVSFSILLGISLGSMGPRGEPMVTFFTILSELCMTITSFVIKFTPVGVLFLILPRIVEVDDIGVMLKSVGLFTATVLLGLVIHGLMVLPAIYFVFTKSNPYKHIAAMAPAMLTAFGTSSSAATLPMTIKCLEEGIKLDTRIIRFVVPIGATVNMDGQALYEAVSAIFIAQSRGMELSVVQVIIISLVATAVSAGAAGIPSAGSVTTITVLNAIGLPAEDVVLIIVVDWFLDRFRTCINVLGDTFGAAVIQYLCQDQLDDGLSRKKHDNQDALSFCHGGALNDVKTTDIIHTEL